MPLGNQYTPLPRGGSTGDVLTKDTNADNACSWRPAGAGSGDVTKDAIASGTTITTIADTDVLAVVTPGTPNVLKKILWSAFKTVLNGIYALTGHNHDSSYVAKNTAITGATKTKITYDTKGLVTAGADATQDDIGDGSTYKRYSATDKSKLAGIEANADVTDIGNVSTVIGGASAATPVDADKFPFYDDTDGTLKTVTGANLKTYIGASAGMDIHGLSAETTVEDADELPFYDNSASANKKITFANFWLKVKGLVSSFVFPVGRVVMFDNTTSDPNTLYGNTWSRVDGGFVGMYKSGDANFGTAGAAVTGGSKTKNMEHDHVVPAVPAYCQPAGSPGYPMWGTPTGKALSTAQDVLNPGWVLCVWRRTA
jgi:hypothetical protein